MKFDELYAIKACRQLRLIPHHVFDNIIVLMNTIKTVSVSIDDTLS